MSKETIRPDPEDQNIESQKIPEEETVEIREFELPPTPQDIDMPDVKPPRDEEEGEED
jgi:hypothetical protein